MAHQAGSAADLERLMEEYGTGLLRLCALQLGHPAKHAVHTASRSP